MNKIKKINRKNKALSTKIKEYIEGKKDIEEHIELGKEIYNEIEEGRKVTQKLIKKYIKKLIEEISDEEKYKKIKEIMIELLKKYILEETEIWVLIEKVIENIEKYKDMKKEIIKIIKKYVLGNTIMNKILELNNETTNIEKKEIIKKIIKKAKEIEIYTSVSNIIKIKEYDLIEIIMEKIYKSEKTEEIIYYVSNKKEFNEGNNIYKYVKKKLKDKKIKKKEKIEYIRKIVPNLYEGDIKKILRITKNIIKKNYIYEIIARNAIRRGIIIDLIEEKEIKNMEDIEKTFNMIINDKFQAMILKKLIENGYILTYENIIHCLKKKIDVTKYIERFKIEYTPEIYYYLYKNKIKPKEYNTIYDIYKICYELDVKKLEEYIEKGYIKEFNKYCIELVLKKEDYKDTKKIKKIMNIIYEKNPELKEEEKA